MALKGLLNNRRVGEFGLGLSRLLPPVAGRWLANRIAAWLARQKDLPMVRAIRLNQWVVSGCSLSSEELDQAVLEVLRQITGSFYTLFHYLSNPAGMQRLIEYSPQIESLIEFSHQRKQGAVIAGLHMTNFDMLMQATLYHGLQALAISLPKTTDAIEWQHRIRRRTGVELLPASFSAFRQAIRHLESGGVVITGMDHPIEGLTETPKFFGQPALVPVHYAYLALKARVPVIVMGAVQGADGIYRFQISDFITLQPHPDHQKEILNNAEMLLEVASGFIQQAPRQWVIFQAVWPHLLSQVP